MKDKTQTVPIGLVPKWIHDQQRLEEIKDAVVRYIDAGIAIPEEWMKEYEELIRK